MFEWLKRQRVEPREFADNAEAFAYACSLDWQPLIGAVLPALVEEDGGRGPEGEHRFLISLARRKHPLKLWTCTLKEAKKHPEVGDLVGFRVVMVASDLPEDASLIGYLACKLAPVLIPRKGWAVTESYTPKDIKQDIHF
jgi:hypothetical protein